MVENDSFPILHADAALLRAVDSACAEAVQRGGEHIVCRPGCTGCCMGAFPISQGDALRLARGLKALDAHDPARALAVRQRADQAVARVGSEVSDTAIEDLEEDEPCPALDSATGLCDLYEYRPLTCRMFGPAIRSASGSVGVCELCFEGTPEETIESCAVDLDAETLEAPLLETIRTVTGRSGVTVVALALLAEPVWPKRSAISGPALNRAADRRKSEPR